MLRQNCVAGLVDIMVTPEIEFAREFLPSMERAHDQRQDAGKAVR